MEEPAAVLAIDIYGGEGELRWYLGDTMERYFYRRVSAAEVAATRMVLKDVRADDLPELSAIRTDRSGGVTGIVGGVQYVYLHLNSERGARVLINNPPDDAQTPDSDDLARRYTNVVRLFQQFKSADTCEMRYSLLRPTPGLEVLYASPDTDIVAVWQQYGKPCVSVRQKWDFDAEPQHRCFEGGKLGSEVPDAQ